MNSQMPKLLLYETRSVGQKVSATFDFLRENRKIWFLLAFLPLLPVSLLLALTHWPMDYWYDDVLMFIGIHLDYGDGLFPLPAILLNIGIAMVIALNYTLMALYRRRENRLHGLTLREWAPLFCRLLLKTVVLMPLIFLLLRLLDEAMPLSYPFMLLFFPLLLVPCVYLFEDMKNPFRALFKGIKLGFSAWGSFFVLLLLISLTTLIIRMGLYMPILFLQSMGDALVYHESYGVWVSFMEIMLKTIYYLFLFGAIAVYLIAAAYQYGHAADKEDDNSLKSDIIHFETL